MRPSTGVEAAASGAWPKPGRSTGARSGAGAAGLRVTAPVPESTWRELLARDPDALVSQSPEWIRAQCAGGHFRDASRLYETAAGKRIVLPMLRRSGPLPPRLAVQASMPPACGMGGFVAEEPPDSAEMAQIAAHLANEPALRTGIRPNPLHAELWSGVGGRGVASIPRRAHVLDLRGGPDEAWKALSKKARAGVRKAEREGIEVECSTDGRLVPVFYELLELSVERWAGVQHEPPALARWRLRRRDPIAKFEHWAAALGQKMQVWVARKDGVPAAAMIVVAGTNANDTRGAMNKELAAPTRANDLLQWRAIQHSALAGCRHYHLGESGESKSLAHFKEKFGARPVPYRELRIEVPGLSRVEAAPRNLVKGLLRFKDA